MSTPPVHCAHAAMVPVGEIKEHPRNPNRHPQSQIDLLVKLVTRTGWRHPIVVSRRSNCVVAGHGRLYAARTAEAPVDYQDFASEAEESAHLVADNRLAELSTRVVELCPLNAAAIIERWHGSTGQMPQLAA